ncbi:hypothetical protein [Microcystis phage Mae-JY22]
MDWDPVRVAVDVTQFLVVGAVAIYAHMNSRGRVTEDRMHDEVARLDSVLKAHGAAIAAVTETVRMSPTHTDIEDLGRRLGELHGDIQKVDGRLAGIGSTVQMINEHLLAK